MASGKTSRRKLPFPQKEDPDRITSDIAGLAEALDNDAETGSVGKFSELPAAKLRGRLWYVEESAKKGVYWDTGVSWVAINALLPEQVTTEKLATESVTPEKLAVGNGGRSVKSIIVTEQTRENTAYGTLATPDEVTVVMPENGLIAVAFQATWKESSNNAGRAAIFLGANQLKIASSASTAPIVAAEASIGTGSFEYTPLSSQPIGLLSGGGTATYTGDVTTGQIVGIIGTAGACLIFAAAGSYKVSVQFKASVGKVAVKNRRLWAWVIA